MGKLARETSLKELHHGISSLFNEFDDPPIVVAGDFNKVKMEKM
jgi:hypothetical protein